MTSVVLECALAFRELREAFDSAGCLELLAELEFTLTGRLWQFILTARDSIYLPTMLILWSH